MTDTATNAAARAGTQMRGMNLSFVVERQPPF